MKQEFNQFLELTNEGIINYSLIKMSTNNNEPNQVIFTTSQKVSEKITENEDITQETKTMITSFFKRISEMLNVMIKMKRIPNVEFITIIVPTELTVLKSEIYDCSNLAMFDVNYLTAFANDQKTSLNGFKEIMKENKALIINENRISFSEVNKLQNFSNAKMEILKCFVNETYFSFFMQLIKKELNIKIAILSRANAIKKELMLKDTSESMNQPKIIFDWNKEYTWIEVKDGTNNERFKLNVGINNIVDLTNKLLQLDGLLNKTIINTCYLKTVNIAVQRKAFNWFRTKNKQNKIVEISNKEMKQCISKAINEIMANLCLDLKEKFNIYDINDVQKFHFGELTKIKGIKDYYKTISFDRGYNHFVVANNYEHKFEGIYTDAYHLPFVLIENQRLRYLNEFNNIAQAREFHINRNLYQQNSASYYKQKPQYVKKEKVVK